MKKYLLIIVGVLNLLYASETFAANPCLSCQQRCQQYQDKPTCDAQCNVVCS